MFQDGQDWSAFENTNSAHVAKMIKDMVSRKDKLLEEALEEYLLEVHGVSVEQLKKVSNNVNNLRLKNFMVTRSGPNLSNERYLYKNEPFLYVLGDGNIIKRWK